MRVPAVERPRSAVWHCWDHVPGLPSLLALGVWTEQRTGLGEDAEPLLVQHRSGGCGMIGVFDGVGGAGSGRTGRSVHGVDRTGAWVGSRTARVAAEEWFRNRVETALDHEPDGLRVHLAGRLRQMRTPTRRKILGSMRRELPSTIAALTYRVSTDHLTWQALWAGDSRSYLLDPARGLQQLSKDDTEIEDTLALLTEDPPMTNLLSADHDFRINLASGEAPLPCLLLCATDGFFGYVGTPAEFEDVLLRTLMVAEDEARWCELLVAAVAEYTGDDASLAIAALGFVSFADMRAHFARRARYIEDEHAAPMRQAVDGADRAAFIVAREDSWNRYRQHYEQRIPVRHGEIQR